MPIWRQPPTQPPYQPQHAHGPTPGAGVQQGLSSAGSVTPTGAIVKQTNVARAGGPSPSVRGSLTLIASQPMTATLAEATPAACTASASLLAACTPTESTLHVCTPTSALLHTCALSEAAA